MIYIIFIIRRGHLNLIYGYWIHYQQCFFCTKTSLTEKILTPHDYKKLLFFFLIYLKCGKVSYVRHIELKLSKINKSCNKSLNYSKLFYFNSNILILFIIKSKNQNSRRTVRYLYFSKKNYFF